MILIYLTFWRENILFFSRFPIPFSCFIASELWRVLTFKTLSFVPGIFWVKAIVDKNIRLLHFTRKLSEKGWRKKKKFKFQLLLSILIFDRIKSFLKMYRKKKTLSIFLQFYIRVRFFARKVINPRAISRSNSYFLWHLICPIGAFSRASSITDS